MTTIRSGAPRVASTSSASTAQAPAKASTTQRSDLPGYSASSSFQAATGSSGGSNHVAIFNDARAALDGLDASPERDELKTLLEKKIPSKKGLEKAMELYGKLQQSGADPAELKKIEKALVYQMAGRTLIDNLQSQTEKMMNEIANKKRE